MCLTALWFYTMPPTLQGSTYPHTLMSPNHTPHCATPPSALPSLLLLVLLFPSWHRPSPTTFVPSQTYRSIPATLLPPLPAQCLRLPRAAWYGPAYLEDEQNYKQAMGCSSSSTWLVGRGYGSSCVPQSPDRVPYKVLYSSSETRWCFSASSVCHCFISSLLIMTELQSSSWLLSFLKTLCTSIFIPLFLKKTEFQILYWDMMHNICPLNICL